MCDVETDLWRENRMPNSLFTDCSWLNLLTITVEHALATLECSIQGISLFFTENENPDSGATQSRQILLQRLLAGRRPHVVVDGSHVRRSESSRHVQHIVWGNNSVMSSNNVESETDDSIKLCGDDPEKTGIVILWGNKEGIIIGFGTKPTMLFWPLILLCGDKLHQSADRRLF